MGNIQEPEFTSLVKEGDEQATKPRPENKKRWGQTVIYTLFVLVGQAGATLLARLYYNEGGNSIFLAALLETIGFPILIPFALYFSPTKLLIVNKSPTNDQPSLVILALVYLILGLFQAAASVLYAVGLQNLPVSTFSLISAMQLAFNAFFSFFINAQKITPPILNSLVLLTISSALLIFHSNSDTVNPKSKKLILGFSCTLTASALYSLMLSLTQLSFQKILKRDNFRTVLNILIYQSFVETCVLLTTLFATGEWCGLRNEMGNFGRGQGSYVLVLVLIAVAWQVFSVGAVGLIFEVSSLFSNVISTVGLPIMPVLGAVFFREKMDGLKVISVFLAAGGFASYVYQHYLDESKIDKGDGTVKAGLKSFPAEV